MVNLLKSEFTSYNGTILIGEEDHVKLCATQNIVGQKFYGEQQKFSFVLHNEFQPEEFFFLKYSCLGIRRMLSFRKAFLYAITENGEEPLVCYDDISTDNRIHNVIVKMPAAKCNGIKIEFSIDRRPNAEFTIFEMYTCKYEELPICCDAVEIDNYSKGYSPIDISTLYNSSLTHEENDLIIDGGRFFDRNDICIKGIPFHIAVDGNNKIAPSPAPKENEEIILNFGVPVKRGLCRPISRDSVTEIAIDRVVSEIYFILEVSGNRYQRWGFASDGTILGDYCGDVTMPLLINDVEGFMVEIVYENGKIDTAVPLNLSTKRHGIQGDINAYAVPASPWKVKCVKFHNRKLDTDFSIVAITVNETDIRKFPEMLIPEMPKKIVYNTKKTREIGLYDNILFVCNGTLEMKIDLSNGMKLLQLKNDFVDEHYVNPDSMLLLREKDGKLNENFKYIDAIVQDEHAEIIFESGQLKLTVSVALAETDSILWNVSAENTGENPIKTGIIFPRISGLNTTDNSDLWYFVPKYQNINSNETVYIYEESAPSFPMQFLDVYSKLQQGGLSLTTRERGLKTRKYSLVKDENGIEFFVEYPDIYGEILPHDKFCGSDTLITAHSGDWHKSFDIYKNWLDSWYEPYKCQNKQWYRECFWLIAEITDFMETREIYKFPCWNDDETGKIKFLDILEEQKEIFGCYPDILHLWAWTHYVDDSGEVYICFGNFGESDYERYGGKEAFRNALQEVRNKGVNVSLYLHPTLLSGRYPQAKEFFPKYKVVNDIGENISLGDAYRMCHANEEWRKHAISMYPRIYKDLGIPLLYVDEFSLRIENRCYGEGHGHPIPSSLLQTDRDLISELKDAMPEEVVLYGEYAAVDVNARYIDCNISYYIIDSIVDMIETAWRADDGDDTFSRVFTNVYRFAFPKIVQLILPMAMRHLSWHPQKFMFFNGEAIYDSFWDVEESSGKEFTVKAYKLKKKYADCFSSDTPTTMIETLSPAICSNCFPGKGRTLYTIYNRAYVTYRGGAIRVLHKEGNVYYDAWNDVPIKTVIKDGYAELQLEIGAMEMGCIVVESSTSDN